MKNFIFLFLIINPLLSIAANEHQLSLPLFCSESIPSPSSKKLSQVFKQYGVHYLMLNIDQQDFPGVLEGFSGAPQDFFFDLSNKEKPNHPNSFKTNYGLSLIPLFDGHHGRWAHNLIKNSQDSLAHVSTRIIKTNDWQIGFVFPVEAIDTFSIEIDSRLTPEYLSFNNKPSYQHSDPVDIQLHALLSYLASDNKDTGFSLDIFRSLKILSPKGQLNLSKLAFLWIPAPLLKHMQKPHTYQSVLGVSDPRIPLNLNQPMHFDIFEQDQPTEQNSEVTERQENLWNTTKQHWNNELQLGTWFDTFPNLKWIKKQLEGQPQGQALIPFVDF